MVPVALLADKLRAVVVGGGTIGTRKARTFLDAGARVSVIAISMSEELSSLASSNDRLTIEKRAYRDESDLENADIVIAATESVEVNSRIARDAERLHRLVSVVNAPAEGSFTSMAIHRSENLTIGVSAGRAPRDAMRVRDAIADRFAELAGDSV